MSDFRLIFWNSLKLLLKNFIKSSVLILFFLLCYLGLLIFEFFLGQYFIADLHYILILKLLAISLIISPLYYGIILWFTELYKGERHALWETFGFYTSFSLILRCIFHSIISIFLNLISLLPATLLASASYFSWKKVVYTGETAFLVICICLAVATVAVALIGLVFSAKWQFSSYLFVTTPELPVCKSFILSARYMKGKASRAFLFGFGADFICLITLFVFPVSLALKSLMQSSFYCKTCVNKDSI